MVSSIRELANRIRSGRTTSAALVEECLGTIAKRDKQVNAFIRVLSDAARERARQADHEMARRDDLGILHGIPVSVKDLIDLEGLPTTAASKLRIDHRATADAQVLARLRAAGVVFIGKCNLHEFAFGTTGEDSAYGPTRNPHAQERVAGGSSSGSAASVAAEMTMASVGTDTGGSIRIPAAACGVVGLKPTYGELSTGGVIPLAPTLDHVGPIGRTVDDVAIVYKVMSGGTVAVGDGKNAPAEQLDSEPRLAIPRRYFLDILDTDVRDAFEGVIARLRNAGCRTHEVAIEHYATVATAYRHTQLYEAFQRHRHTLETQGDDYSPDVRKRLELGRTVSEDEYDRAQRDRQVLRGEVDAVLEGASAIVLPTLAIPAPPLGSESVVIERQTLELRSVFLRLTQLFNLTGHPAISVPCGTTRDGLPCATQLVGKRNETETLLRFASRYESIIQQSG